MAVDILQEKIRKLKNPTMLELSPVREDIPAHLLEEASGIVAAGQLVGQLYAPYFLLVEALEYGNVRKEHDGCDEREDVHEKVEPAQAGKAGHEQVFRGRIEQGDA